ncbi:MAG TPA: hypothetical protein GX708_08220 [Gallicola sp.]|nr:hypothetical protein [Gallicola sp.]
MGNKHKVLNENTFRNSKYIQVVNKQIGCNDFKKFCESNNEYKGQFDFMLDTFKTFILIRNCFFCDSNLSMNDKVENAQKIIGKYLFSDFDEENNETISDEGKSKYSVRFIQNVCEKYSTHLYRRIKEWYYDYLDNYSLNSNINSVLDDIKDEMSRLESVGFDDYVKENINFKKNKDSNYKIYISKFDSLYSDNQTFEEEFIKEYNDNHITPLTDDELGNIYLVYTLIVKCCNGITILLENKPIEEFNLNERTTPTELFNIYLSQLNLNQDRYDFRMEALQFMLQTTLIYPSCAKRGLSFNEMMNNFDICYFLIKMGEIINDKEFKITDEQIQKDFKDLKEIYDIIHSPVKSVDETLEHYRKASTLIYNLISKKRIANYFIRVS